jgi:hypothetical protein
VKAKIDFKADHYQTWFTVDSLEYDRRPRGFYLYSDTGKMCYGPFETYRKAEFFYNSQAMELDEYAL